jgi:hypothetical protein
MSWKLDGEYMETCNCTFLCPCITSNLTATPTEGDCKVAIAMRVDQGEKDGVKLDGVAFVVAIRSPKAMAEGDLTVGLIVDDRASDAQAEAIGAIATGAAGGPMAALAPLVGRIAGIERRPIRYEADGLRRSVTAGDLVDQACEGLPGADPDSPQFIDNVAHPLSTRLALAKAVRSKFHAFGMDWDDSSGTRNGHFSRFSWSG